MTHKDFSEKKMENVTSQANDWLAGFKESGQFNELASSAQANSEVVIMALSEWMYKEELRAGREWTATTLENILVNVFPKEVANYEQVAPDLASILTNYFTFLKEDKKIANADTLLRKLAKLSFSEVVAEPQKAKDSQTKVKKATKAKDSVEYSQTEIAQFNRFAMGNTINQRAVVAPEPVAQPAVSVAKVGRNEPCPCGSGKKYKKCHGN